MRLCSTAFEHNGPIPRKHTGFGEDLSPCLTIDQLPAGTVSLAVILEDLDVPLLKPFPHWIIWNIPPTSCIPEGIPYGENIDIPFTAIQGQAWGKHGYRGPKQPPFIKKAHRYRFTLFALDRMLNISSSCDCKTFRRITYDNLLETAELIGFYRP